MRGHGGETRLDDLHELVVGVAGEGDTGEAESAADLVAQGALGQIHSVGHGKDDEPAVAQTGPVEEIVHDALVLRHQLV